MNPFKLRLTIFLCIALALAAHGFATTMTANDPEGMAIYHGSGALMDLLLALVVTDALAGVRGRVMGYLMLASIAANIAGWLLYMAYISPVYYNTAMWSLTAAQVACLLLPANFFQSIKSKAASLLPWSFFVRAL